MTEKHPGKSLVLSQTAGTVAAGKVGLLFLRSQTARTAVESWTPFAAPLKELELLANSNP
jgi:hypothetical protein